MALEEEFGRRRQTTTGRQEEKKEEERGGKRRVTEDEKSYTFIVLLLCPQSFHHKFLSPFISSCLTLTLKTFMPHLPTPKSLSSRSRSRPVPVSLLTSFSFSVLFSVNLLVLLKFFIQTWEESTWRKMTSQEQKEVWGCFKFWCCFFLDSHRL